jgi:hypothetical protein
VISGFSTIPYPSASDTDAGIAAVELERLLIKEKTTPTTTMKETMTITRLRVPLSEEEFDAIITPYLSSPNLPFGK